MSTATEKQLAIERAIAHRRCVEALTSIQAPLEVLRPVFKTAGFSKALTQMDKIERWLDACIKPLAAKKFGAKARDEFSQKNNFLAQTADMESMSHEERFAKWCALYMAGMFLLWDCRISCKQYADNQQWTYLDMTATTLGNMLMQMAPGCDEAGTSIYMALHGYAWDTAERQQIKEAA